ncbi:MAG: single-stranded-DNA-specific exonuclease RecJ, partial [Clostridiales bacterium]|nr:single-stranded-DNA-specific exonuclease RecJ [Clostridiales bacterium]
MNIKKWRINTPDLNKVGEITRKTDISEVCAKLLSSRGIDTISSIEDFFSHGVDFSDPFLMADMYDAVERLHNAINAGEKIIIYGDYDCDGITSTVMLLSYLQSFGADASYYIPSREVEGYGLNSNAVKALAEQGADLIITV